jgi:Macrocin-O-methyltransferase (TylF)
MQLFDLARRFLEKNPRERLIALKVKVQQAVGALLYVLMPRLGMGIVFTAYHPDSARVFGQHPQFKMLLPHWLHRNRINNGGDTARYYSLILNIKQVLEDQIPGDFAELGVYLGNSAAVLAHFAFADRRTLFLFDTFAGFDQRDLVGVDSSKALAFTDTSLAGVQANVGHAETCVYLKGYFPQSVTEEVIKRSFAFVHLDCDLYKPMKDGLDFFYPRLSPGGMLFLHDYSSGHWPGAKKAVDEFSERTGELPILLPDKSGTAVIRKKKR